MSCPASLKDGRKKACEGLVRQLFTIRHFHDWQPRCQEQTGYPELSSEKTNNVSNSNICKDSLH